MCHGVSHSMIARQLLLDGMCRHTVCYVFEFGVSLSMASLGAQPSSAVSL